MEDLRKDSDQQKNKPILWELLDWVKYIGAAVLIALILTQFIIFNAVVPTGSMEATIMTGDRLIANRLAYLFSEPKRGDIIVFKFPDDENITYTKRIIGLPGETVEISQGTVTVDGKKLNEPYLEVITEGTFGPFQVPEDSYFMMGDNRNNSFDSRMWEKTYLKRDKILAKVMFEYFPKIRWIE